MTTQKRLAFSEVNVNLESLMNKKPLMTIASNCANCYSNSLSAHIILIDVATQLWIYVAKDSHLTFCVSYVAELDSKKLEIG